MASTALPSSSPSPSPSPSPPLSPPPAPADWSPTSWKAFPAAQQPTYKDEDAAKEALKQVRRLPPLVSAEEVNILRSQLAEVAQGKRFLLQGGDCAERFIDCTSDKIEKKLKILLQMSLILTWGARVPTVRIARLAGQFSKPRSRPTEVVDGKTYSSFRGDNINSFDLSAREHDPSRLVSGYFHSAATLNYCRALLAGGFADLHASTSWDLGFAKDHPSRAKYMEMVERILSALEFMRVCGVDDQSESIRTVHQFISHEGLTLPYEEALTRKVGDAYYNLGTHFVWIGDRTRALDGAHVEYFRGIANPIGIKVGPSMDPSELVPLINKLWPDPAAQPGKIVLITRLGANRVEELLPPLIKVVQEAKLPVVWQADPMHGNTTSTESGVKTRDFDDILKELDKSFEVHARLGSQLGGVHFELTGENVTECIGGPQQLGVADLSKEYSTYCDPRMNYAQSMEMAFRISEFLLPRARTRRPRSSSISVLGKEGDADADADAEPDAEVSAAEGVPAAGAGGGAAGGAGDVADAGSRKRPRT